MSSTQLSIGVQVGGLTRDLTALGLGGYALGMTTTPTTPSPPPPTAHQQGAQLLGDYLRQMAVLDYQRIAIDTWRHRQTRHNLRHSYTNGEWTITHWVDGFQPRQVRWSTRATMPDVLQLLGDTSPSMA